MPYRDAIVSYVDLLGFRALIEASDSDPSKVEDITRILQATEIKGTVNSGVQTFQGQIEQLADTRIFSDLIVRTTRKRNELNMDIHLNFELSTLARIQWEFIQFHSVLVRGGVSYRKMNQHGYLFGPGLVRSYELAEKIAVVPRIIIDSELVRLMGDLSDPWWKNILGRGEDGQYFIDYLNSQVRLGDMLAGTNTLNTQILIRHKAFILDEIAKLKPKAESVRQKIIWMGLYHNKTIERLSRDYDDERRRLERFLINPQRIA